MRGYKPRRSDFTQLALPRPGSSAVLLGPLRALSYVLNHGLLAATLGTLWQNKAGLVICVLVGAVVRMAGQVLYLILTSVTMNENMFALVLSNVYNMLVRNAIYCFSS
jgi:hypothetical protein